MCNVYAMYSYEPTKTADGKVQSGATPFSSCYGDAYSQMSA